MYDLIFKCFFIVFDFSTARAPYNFLFCYCTLDQDHTKQSVFVEQEEMEIGPHIPENLVPYSNRNQPLSPVYSNHLIPEPVLHLQQLQQQSTQPPVVSITPATPGTPSISSPGIPATPTTAVKVVRPTQLSLRPAVPLHADSSTVFGDVNANRLPASPG